MQAEITFLTHRGTAVMRKTHLLTAESIRFGRGTDNEVPLADIRAELTAASLRQGADGLVIEQLGDSPLRVNGQTTATSPIRPDDEILIGPYRIVLGDPPAGLDVALSVELVEPIGDSVQRLLTQSRIGLDKTKLSKRRASWLLFTILTILCLAVPIALYSTGGGVKQNASAPADGGSSLLGIAWNPGEISNPHRYFARNCAACHQNAFAAVKDSACLSCHSKIGNHVKSAVESDPNPVHQRLQTTRCADCHEEHRGLRSLVIREGALCVGCHRSLTEIMPSAGLRDVRGFPNGHPQFRVSVVADAKTQRLTRSGLVARP
jgi:predicted CXXCH cytochrome family protein